jgi:TolA-binding protein
MQETSKGSPGLPFVLRWRGLGALAVALLLGAGCAEVTGESVQQDVDQLRRDLNAITLAMHRSRGETEAVLGELNRRTAEQAGESTRQMGTLVRRVDALAAEVARLSARLDEASQRIESVHRQLAARPVPARPASPPAPPPATARPPATAPVARPAGEGPGAEQAYQTAYLDFTKGNYTLAISAFREFIRRFPDAAQADDAQYWIGESYFSLGRSSAAQGQGEKATQALEQSVQEFRKVALNYPRGDRVPTAIYKEALALLELRQTPAARDRLRYLIDHFPQSEEAPLAKDRLAAISG